MKSLNELRSQTSRQIDRTYDLNRREPAKDKAKPKGGLAARVNPYPPGQDGAKILNSIAQVEAELAQYDFDRSKYDEAGSRAKLERLAASLIAKGVPKPIVDAGLRQPLVDLGRRGVRHLFHWNAQKPIHRRRIQRSFARMKSLVAPVAAAQDRLRTETASRDLAIKELEQESGDLAKLKDQKAGLESHGKAMGFGKYSRDALARVNQEIANLEEDIGYNQLIVADAQQEIAPLTTLIAKLGGDDSNATSHFGRVQNGLDRLGESDQFIKTYDKLHPGARRSRFSGYWRKRLAHPFKAIGKKLLALVTLSGSSILMAWRGAIKAQDKARRFATAQHHLPTPAARMMAAVLLDRFDAEAYKRGLGAAMATAHLPLAVHIPGVYSLASGPIVSAIGSSSSAHVGNELAKDFAKDGIGDVYGEIKAEFAGKTEHQVIRKGIGRRDAEPFPMPTVPISINKGAGVKHVDLSDKKTALALLIHLGPAVDQDKVDGDDEAEISRRDLRREIFKADDAEDFSADAKGKMRSARGKKFDKKLVKALFDPEHENRDNVLQQASAMHKMFAAAGLL